MKIHFSQDFKKKSSKLIKNNYRLKKQLIKQFGLFQNNPRHPSLKLHQLEGKRSKQFSIWIKGNLRALCIKSGRKYIFFDLNNHDKY